MNEREYLLTVLVEECAEVAQRACKAMRFGLFETEPGQPDGNKRRLERELADLMATAELMSLIIRDEDKVAKREKLQNYMNYSRQIGTLEVPDKPRCTCSIDGTTYCKAQGTGFCKAENP